MSQWGWRPERSQGIWRHGAAWFKPFVAAVPVLNVMLLLLMLHYISGSLVAAEGIAFELPTQETAASSLRADVVALLMPTEKGMLVFFDDARYILDDRLSANLLGEHLAERLARSDAKSLLVLADRRTTSNDLMKFASLAREHGVTQLLFAEKGSSDSKQP